MVSDKQRLAQGATNLLLNCAELVAGEKVLVVREPAALGYYDDEVAEEVAVTARELGIIVKTLEVPFNPIVKDPGTHLSGLMADADCTIFFARLGDQLRFRESSSRTTSVMSYALDAGMLASRFGRTSYADLIRVKTLVDKALSEASSIRVTCPAGTNLHGTGQQGEGQSVETTVRRFPLSVFSPVLAESFSGVVAQRGFLCNTGSQSYEPPACEILDVLNVCIESGKIVRFEGRPDDVERAERHYTFVSELFGLDKYNVHSWHAGIHPGCAYRKPANYFFDRWSNGAFGNPRVLHFHTCGQHAPGEISLNVIDPTILLDGVTVWDSGVLRLENIKGGKDLLDASNELRTLFSEPENQCGLGPSGHLEF